MLTRRRALEVLALSATLLLGATVPLTVDRLGDEVEAAPAAQSDAGGFDGTGKVLIRKASMVLTMDPKLGQGRLGQLEKPDVLMTGDTVTAVGPNLSSTGARVIDGRGKIVSPAPTSTASSPTPRPPATT
ncbi:hypothetical protein [Kribbella deserti]|uniref:Uncharacterized protein n=1 Tax=Kribbella deserti TaxID=1926257 RepID=A0ABV6QKW9_9ACTN